MKLPENLRKIINQFRDNLYLVTKLYQNGQICYADWDAYKTEIYIAINEYEKYIQGELNGN